MLPTSFMLIAGEASGDRLAAELVAALRARWWASTEETDLSPMSSPEGPTFFGAGGEAMRAAGVELLEDMTHRGIIGVTAALRRLLEFHRLMNRLVRVAAERQPEVIVTVDYGAFNLRFQARVRQLLRARRGPFNNWQPKLVQFVSPQVWGSRPGRAFTMERNLDLLISILPFERDWFAERTPRLKLAFVGHPLIGRHASPVSGPPVRPSATASRPLIVLLPGSRRGELREHLPVTLEAVRRIRRELDCRFTMVLPRADLAGTARQYIGEEPIDVLVGGVEEVLPEAALAISKTGTITLELALFGVPAVTFYKTSWATYWIARQLVTVKWLTMPNLLAGDEVFPEFVQSAATGDAIARAALKLLTDETFRRTQRQHLGTIVQRLGEPGAPARAAAAIFDLVSTH